jgi:hypothetical protein
MCGDVDEDEAGDIEERLFARFLAHAQALLSQHGASQPAPAGDPYPYMDKLFADALSRCARDGAEIAPDARYQRLATQPLVFARLAGFLAAHLAVEQDPLRKVIEALMLGYGEAEALDHGHDHDHEHGHGHAHDHHH